MSSFTASSKIQPSVSVEPVNSVESYSTKSTQGEPVSEPQPLNQSALSPSSYPRLACTVSFYPDRILFVRQGQEFAYSNQAQISQALQVLCSLLDGTRSLADIQASFPEKSRTALTTIIQSLTEQNLIVDVRSAREPSLNVETTDAEATHQPSSSSTHTLPSSLEAPEVNGLSGQALLLQFKQILETHLADCLPRSSASSPSSEAANHRPSHPQFLYEFALELHQFLAQQTAFLGPLFDFQAADNAEPIRQALAEYYRQGQIQQTILAQALGRIGVDEVAIADHLPLPETVALIHGLAFWAQTEPLFALSLQAPLAEALTQSLNNSDTGDHQKLDPTFVQSIQQLIQQRESFSNQPLETACYSLLDLLDKATQQRFLGQFRLLSELYCNWLEAIAARIHHSSRHPSQSQRCLSAITGAPSPKRPHLKTGVFVRFTENNLEIREAGQGIAIALEPTEQSAMQQLVRCLQLGGLSVTDLHQICPTFGSRIEELLEVFQTRNWLEQPKAGRPLSGRQFYFELSRFLTQLKQGFPPSPMAKKMMEGSITRNQLLGYVLESYHVTHLCPRLLAPALAQFESRATQKLLQEFFTSELHHDRLVENSLTSVGISLEQIHTMQPLPMTFAVCSTLGVLARRHPLSFKSALMLFEEDDQFFHQLFQQCSENLGMPEGFYRPILLHAKINEDGEHDQITQVLLDELSYIPVEEQQTVKRNMAVLMSSMVSRTHQILEYYGNPQNLTPRCFS